MQTLLLNKYYVDEAYDAGIVQPIKIVSEQALWKVIDVRRHRRRGQRRRRRPSRGASVLLRRLQTGSVRAYAASLFLGVVGDSGLLLVALIQVTKR